MFEPKHTPAPWSRGIWEGNPEKVEIYAAKGADKFQIGEVSLWTDGPEEAMANANLIAAAPELLEVLSEIRIRQAEDGKIWIVFRPSGEKFAISAGIEIKLEEGIQEIAMNSWLIKAKAAIAKAEGK
jgi:hypothetical protein